MNFNNADEVNLVDVGRIRSVICHILGSGHDAREYEVVTEFGVFKTTDDILSCQMPLVEVVLHDGQSAWVVDERICALNFSITGNYWMNVIREGIKEGDELPLMDSDEAWDFIRRNCEYNLIDKIFPLIRLRRKWFQPGGARTTEPSWFLPKLTMWLTFASTRFLDMGKGCHKTEYEQLQHLLAEALSRSERWFLECNEFNKLCDVSKIVMRAAKSINRHIDNQDYMPNTWKVDAVRDIDMKFVDDAAAKSDFALHLQERIREVLESERDGFKLRVRTVANYHPSIFPETFVRKA